jgi:hypothetical protein
LYRPVSITLIKSHPRLLLVRAENTNGITRRLPSDFSRKDASPAPMPVASMTILWACQWFARAKI